VLELLLCVSPSAATRFFGTSVLAINGWFIVDLFFISMSALHRVCCGKDLWKIITPEIVQIQCNMLAKE
jgi:hypothetical protein